MSHPPSLLVRRERARELVEALQARHVSRLETASVALGEPVSFEAVDWLRDDGRHGGGRRYQSGRSDQAGGPVALTRDPPGPRIRARGNDLGRRDCGLLRDG